MFDLLPAQSPNSRPLEGQPVTGVKVDSRQVVPGDLFVALAGDPGERFNPSKRSEIDGHDYLADALSRGAVAALVSQRRDVPIDQYVCTDTYAGLWRLGAQARSRLADPVIAITGSSGKTTAKYFLSAALDAYAPPGSLNNHIGVPLSLANAQLDAPAWVFEIGTSRPGEIQPLTAMVQPTLAILLNVQRAHIENFASRHALLAEKAEIFSTLPSDGLRVIHDELDLPGYRFGYRQDAQARILGLENDVMALSLFGERISARVPGGGEHRALTLCACILATKLLQIDLEAVLSLEHSLVPQGRGNIRYRGGVEIVDDSYNANPASMEAALTAFLATPAKGRRYVVLGDMRELGGESAQAHRRLIERVVNAPSLNGIVLVGDAMGQALSERGGGSKGERIASNSLMHYSNSSEALASALTKRLSPGDRLLVKGSNTIFWSENFVEQLLSYLE